MLRLGQTQFFLLPGNEEIEPIVAQVTVRHAASATLDVCHIVNYDSSQREITDVVGTVLAMDRLVPLLCPILVTADTYSLLIDSRPWNVRKRVHFYWGEEELCPAPTRWTITFIPTDPED